MNKSLKLILIILALNTKQFQHQIYLKNLSSTFEITISLSNIFENIKININDVTFSFLLVVNFHHFANIERGHNITKGIFKLKKPKISIFNCFNDIAL